MCLFCEMDQGRIRIDSGTFAVKVRDGAVFTKWNVGSAGGGGVNRPL